MAQLTARTEAWRRAGALTEIAGHQIFVREREGTAGRPPVVFLHGYPSSSYDWRHAFDQLDGHRLVVFDFLGYGLSDNPATTSTHSRPRPTSPRRSPSAS